MDWQHRQLFWCDRSICRRCCAPQEEALHSLYCVQTFSFLTDPDHSLNTLLADDKLYWLRSLPAEQFAGSGANFFFFYYGTFCVKFEDLTQPKWWVKYLVATSFKPWPNSWSSNTPPPDNKHFWSFYPLFCYGLRLNEIKIMRSCTFRTALSPVLTAVLLWPRRNHSIGLPNSVLKLIYYKHSICPLRRALDLIFNRSGHFYTNNSSESLRNRINGQSIFFK